MASSSSAAGPLAGKRKAAASPSFAAFVTTNVDGECFSTFTILQAQNRAEAEQQLLRLLYERDQPRMSVVGTRVLGASGRWEVGPTEERPVAFEDWLNDTAGDEYQYHIVPAGKLFSAARGGRLVDVSAFESKHRHADEEEEVAEAAARPSKRAARALEPSLNADVAEGMALPPSAQRWWYY